jgi:hypothetical protein
MALCVNNICDEMGMLPEDANNPLFDHMKPDHPCILDIGVYNEYRNFRLIHNVKADVSTGKPRAWLSDPFCSPLKQEQRGRPDTPLPLAEFLKHLVRVWDYSEDSYVLAQEDVIVEEIKFYKFKASEKRTSTTARRANHPAASRRAANVFRQTTLTALDDSLDSANTRLAAGESNDASGPESLLSKVKKLVVAYLNTHNPSVAHEAVYTVEHGFSVSTTTDRCIYKEEGPHETSGCVYYTVSLDYPLPTIHHKCFKTPCISKMELHGMKTLSLDDMSDEAKKEYAHLVWEYLAGNMLKS